LHPACGGIAARVFSLIRERLPVKATGKGFVYLNNLTSAADESA
jgi:hypothetical protein